VLYRAGQGQGFQQVTIGSLPDDVLLVVFEFYQVVPDKDKKFAWNWKNLVHVCQRWRYIIFESPIRLNLQLICTVESPVRKSLDVWPPLPLVVLTGNWDSLIDPLMDNTVAALEQRDRVQQIYFSSLDYLQERLGIIAMMQKPFPALRSLTLKSSRLPLSDTFLNGSAPSLQDLALCNITFPSLPRFLSSTSDLTSLHLFNIPYSGYIPPEEMATSLSALPKLKSLIIDFEKTELISLKEIINQVPLLPRFVLPALTRLEFEGTSEYMELLAARIDAPLLDDFQMTFFHWAEFGFYTEFLSDIPQTIRFISLLDSFRSSSLTLEFDLHFRASISFPSDPTCHSAIPPSLYIDCTRLDWQVISVTRICSQILPFCSRIKSLNIKCHRQRGIKQDESEMDPMLWSQLFHIFPSVQRLDIPAMLESSIALALQGLTGESVAEVLPLLHSLFIVGNETAAEGIALATGLWEQPPRMTSSRLFISRLSL
jgi:hypothetical protein